MNPFGPKRDDLSYRLRRSHRREPGGTEVAHKPANRQPPTPKMKLLLIEDDAPTAAMIKRGLESEGYEVASCRDGRKGLETAIGFDFAAIVLDLMLPELSGIQVCEELRARKRNTPILMLTARGEVSDRVKGLYVGADDYLAKPFDFAELLARVHALIRRDHSHKGATIVIDRLFIDTAAQRVRVDGQEISLAPREYSLLEALARNEGRTLTRDVILSSVWLDQESYSNTVDVRILALRKKIDENYERKLIHTVHRLGYVLKREAPK
jgi:DNA-binding response OmpR family regulator